MSARVMLLGNPDKAGVKAAVETVSRALKSKAQLVRVDLELVDSLEDVDADLAIILGGDGTILRVARLMGRRQTPAVGVNFGKFGFLAALDLETLLACLDDMVAGAFEVSERSMLSYSVCTPECRPCAGLALNDVLVSAPSIGRMVGTTMHVSGKVVATYFGDGVIVSTPTGSTGHSLSAGGPVVAPNMEAIVVCPICPHSLGIRPLVLGAAEVLEFEITDGRPAKLLADGQEEILLEVGSRAVIRQADVRFKLLDTGVRSFYDTLRTKLDWKGKPNYGVR